MVAHTATPARVLVIDDEIGPRESLRILLRNEYEVECADSVDRGLDMMRTQNPDLIILDIRMPGMDGITGLQEIRERDKLVSVIMLTGYGALETAQQALRLGANDYLSKPFDTAEMMEIVKRYASRSRLERKRASILKELQELNRRLINDVADKESMAKLGETSSEFIHDLRNPLTIVSGYVELLSNEIEKTRDMVGSDNGHATEYLAVIEQNVKRCCELSQMWQKFRKCDTPQFKPTCVSEIFADLEVGIQPLASTRGVEISFPASVSDAVVSGSRAQILRAVHNVVSNAIQAVTPGIGSVGVACVLAGDNVEIVVTDNGCGMTPEVQAKMFESYFTTREETEGTGLGMVITRKVIEEHHGSIRVQSEPDKGTIFTLSLPRAKSGTLAAAPAAG